MNKLEYDRTRAKLVAEVEGAHAEALEAQKAGAAAREKINRKNEALAALDRVWREFAPPAVEPKPTDLFVMSRAIVDDSKLSWRQVVTLVLAEVPEQFTTQELAALVFERAPSREDNKGNRATISGTVKRLEEEGALRLVERGTGAKPSVYRKINGHAVASPEASKGAGGM